MKPMRVSGGGETVIPSTTQGPVIEKLHRLLEERSRIKRIPKLWLGPRDHLSIEALERLDRFFA